MKISVELSLLPLQDDYKPAIRDFIKKLRNSDFELQENSLNSEIYGEYDELMPFLNTVIRETFEKINAVFLTMKIVKGDRSGYKAKF